MVLGIDLGTSNTVAATVSRDGTPMVIPDAGNKEVQYTPTKVLLHQNRAFVGHISDHLFELYPDKKLLSFFKRQFGSGIPVYTDENQNNWYSESLAALVLKKIIHDTEAFQPDGFEKLVITVPAHYNDVQRKSVYEAARLAGIELSSIIDEPVAAALNYGMGRVENNQELTLVYDFGGGTFDLTLITQTDNHLHVIAKDGIEKLGGKEFDNIISSQIISSYSNLFNEPFPSDSLSINRVQQFSEELKIRLNITEEYNVAKWMIFGKNIFETRFIVREYESSAFALIDQTNQVVNRCLRSMGLQLKDVHKFLLIGGTSNSKLLYRYWLDKLNNTTTKLIYHQPLNSVAKGAAIYANSLMDNKLLSYKPIELKSVSTYNIGILEGGKNQMDVLIFRNSPLPAIAQRHFHMNISNLKNFSIDIFQFWDENEKQILGNIILDEQSEPLENFLLELQIENKANGTIGIKLRNAGNNKEIRFKFTRKSSEHHYDFQQQKILVDQMIVNNIF